MTGRGTRRKKPRKRKGRLPEKEGNERSFPSPKPRRAVFFAAAVTGVAALAVAVWFAEEYVAGPGSAPYRPIIDRWAHEYGVDADLVAAVLECESSGRPRAVSRSGARGLMQLMPETAAGMAAELGLEEPSLRNCFDPELNVRLGTYYLSKLWQRFRGDRVLVIAAYHAGPSRIADSLKRRGNPPGEKLLPDIDAPVTRAYVGKVMRRWESLAAAR